MSYNDIAFDRVLKGVEKILEAEFLDSAIVYLADKYEDYPNKRSIRLWTLPSDENEARTSSVVDSYPVEITCYLPVSQGPTRKTKDNISDFTARVRRLLLNNRTYRLAGVYKWHDGRVSINYSPERSTEEGREEPSPTVMSMTRIIYNVTVEEVF